MEKPNYTLGRGELHFNKFSPGTFAGIGERYFGNTPEVTQNVETENLDHFNSDHGVKEKDASVVLQTTRSMSFMTDHISVENLALWFFGQVNAMTQTAATAQSEDITDPVPGLFYQLGTSATHPTGLRSVSNVVVTEKDTPATIYVQDTDYAVNLELGRVEILEGGAIDGTKDLTVNYDVGAVTREMILSGSKAIEGSLRYLADNPEGENIDYFWPWVKISPNGDMALKGDEWQQLPFNVEIVRRPGYQAVYAEKRAKAVAP